MAADMTELMRKLAAVNAARDEAPRRPPHTSRVAPQGTGFGLIGDAERPASTSFGGFTGTLKLRPGIRLQIRKAAKRLKLGHHRKRELNH